MRVLNRKGRQAFLGFMLSGIFLTGCGKKDDEDALKSYLAQYILKYEVIEENSEGKFEISILAPDLEQVIEDVLEKDENIEISSKILQKAGNENYQKEYRFYSDSDEIKDIEKAFFEEISYELAISAIKNVEYKELWSVEE